MIPEQAPESRFPSSEQPIIPIEEPGEKKEKREGKARTRDDDGFSGPYDDPPIGEDSFPGSSEGEG